MRVVLFCKSCGRLPLNYSAACLLFPQCMHRTVAVQIQFRLLASCAPACVGVSCGGSHFSQAVWLVCLTVFVMVEESVATGPSLG